VRFLLTDGHGSTINGGHLSVNNPLAFAWRPMKRALAITAGLFLAVGSDAAQSSLTVYVEGPDAATALRILHERCPICSAVIKKDGADLIVLLSSTDGKTDLSVFETVSGGLVMQTTAETLDSAMASALEAIRSHVPAPKDAAPPPETGNATGYVSSSMRLLGRPTPCESRSRRSS
jgi:hypothetical protein